MNGIDRWFERMARKRNRTVSLYANLLTGRVFAYFRYRLRYPLLLVTARFAVHVVEFFILLASLGGIATFTVMVLRIGSALIGGGWWGLLEVMRERLRAFMRSGDREAAEHEIGRWLVLAVILALVLTIVVGVAVAVLRPSGPDPVANLYAFLVVVELAIGLPVRVLHSGIFATRRVYRPMWSMFAPIVVQLAVLGAGYNYYPTAAIIVAITVSNAIGIWITVHYSLGAYRLSGLRPRRKATDHNLMRWLPSIPVWAGLKATLSGLGLRLDALLVLAIVGVYGTGTRSFDLTAVMSSWQQVDTFQFFYLILPLFRGAYEGASIFYFDFVRLRRVPALREFRVVFFHKLLWLSPVIALFYWSLAAGLGLLVLQVPLSLLLALMPLFILRSVIGIYQIRLFAEGLFGRLIATMALFGVLLWLIWIDAHPASDLVEITAAMITQLIVLINLQHYRDRQPPPLPALLTLGDWMRTLAQESGPVIVGRCAIAPSITQKQRSATVQLMQQTFEGEGHLAFTSSTTLVYYQRSSGVTGRQTHGHHTHLLLQQMTGGAVNRGSSLPAAATNGRDAIGRLLAANWIRQVDSVSVQPDTLEAVCSEFRRHFAEGIVFDLETLEGSPAMRNLDQSLLAMALPSAVKSHEDGAVIVQVSDRWLTPIYQRGRLRLLLFLPPDPEPALFKSWLRTVKAWNFGLSNAETVRCAPDG